MATPAHRSPAPEFVVAVAPFRVWRGSQHIVAGRPTGATTEPQKKTVLSLREQNCAVSQDRVQSFFVVLSLFNYSLKGGG